MIQSVVHVLFVEAFTYVCCISLKATAMTPLSPLGASKQRNSIPLNLRRCEVLALMPRLQTIPTPTMWWIVSMSQLV
jgi:hypothetical protein